MLAKMWAGNDSIHEVEQQQHNMIIMQQDNPLYHTKSRDHTIMNFDS